MTRLTVAEAVQASEALLAWLDPQAGRPVRGEATGIGLREAAPIGSSAANLAMSPQPAGMDGVAHFSGSGTIPWTFDLDRMEEDWLHLLVSPRAP